MSTTTLNEMSLSERSLWSFTVVLFLTAAIEAFYFSPSVCPVTCTHFYDPMCAVDSNDQFRIARFFGSKCMLDFFNCLIDASKYNTVFNSRNNFRE